VETNEEDVKTNLILGKLSLAGSRACCKNPVLQALNSIAVLQASEFQPTPQAIGVAGGGKRAPW